MKPMNTLILCCDQHNPKMTGCYGNPRVITPNLDALAARGTVFENAYTATPICVPARAALATGNYPFCHGYWDNAHPYSGQQPSWGHRLKAAGIDVTAIGKLHFADDTEAVFPGQRIPMNVKGGLGDLMTACRQTKGTTSKLREQIQAAGVGDCDYLHYDQAIANAAADYLKTEAPSDHPWCLYVGFTTPHYPLKVPAELLKLYEPFDQFPIDPFWHHPEHLHPALQKYKETTEINDSHISEQELQRAVAAYYALVTFMDSQVGVVLEALRQAGLEATTRILYLDDHGDSAGEQGLFFKSTMNEGSVRIPLILSGPDLPKGYRVRENVSIVDLYPTVMEFSGLPLNTEEQSLPGVSLIKTLQGNGDPHRCIYSEYHAAGFDNSVFMLKKDQMKLIHYVGYDRPQLFDLAADPEEQRDLALDPQYQPLIEELEQALHNICDPEALNAQSMQDQQNLIASKGGLEAILKQGLTPFTAVPQAYETKS